MSEVTGVIQKIDSRKVANGTKTAWDLYVAGQKYGAGLFAPKLRKVTTLPSQLTRVSMAGTLNVAH